MSYVVFARKWRPQNFDEIVGQEHIATTLKNAIKLDRVAHAYLFSGPRGVGKTSTARILAKALNCASGPTPKPCNKCTSCHEITAGRSLDCIEIDGASNRGIDEVRELRENVKFSPSGGKFKVYIIDEVHMLTPEAFNALLKTLEEPPKHIKFIFATTRPHKLPATILSRCQRFDFRRIPIELITSKLDKILKEEKIRVDKEALFYIAKTAEGSMRDAESLLDQLGSAKKGELTLKDVNSVLGIVNWELIVKTTEAIKERSTANALKTIEDIFGSGKDITQFIDELVEHFRNIMIARISLKEDSKELSELINLPADQVNTLVEQAKDFSLEDSLYIIQVLSNTRQMLKNSPLLRVPLEMAMVRLTNRKSILSIGEILKKLSALEAKINANNSSEETYAESSSDESVIARENEEQQVIRDSKPEEIIQVWPELLSRLKKVKMSAATYLSAAEPIKLEGRMLTIGFPKDSVFFKEAVEKNHNRETIENILKELLKQDIKISLTLVDKIKVVESEPVIRQREEHEAIIDSALDIFEGRIVKG